MDSYKPKDVAEDTADTWLTVSCEWQGRDQQTNSTDLERGAVVTVNDDEQRLASEWIQITGM